MKGNGMSDDKNRDLDLIEYLNGPAARRLAEAENRVTEQHDLIRRLYQALRGVPTEDGCVSGCPRKSDSDNPHSLRCATVRHALEAADKYRRKGTA